MKRVATYGWAAAGLALAFAAGLACTRLVQPEPRALTQDDIDAAVQHTLHTKVLPSQPARAAAVVRQSVVQIQGFPEESPAKDAADAPAKSGADKPGAARKPPPRKPPAGGKDDRSAKAGAGNKPPEAPKSQMRNVGSGVVITEEGMILTNFHVVAGAHRLVVTFYDGRESEATLVNAMPEKDLAVLRPKSVPDDLPAATLGSTRNLSPGDEVVAVGFPFGIGPSVSAGVVSGLNREFISAEHKQNLSNLIQFDAAANPGNSGGPLIDMNGEVVGIVTAILNPTQSGTFVGIGFATTIESAGSAVGFSPF
ncbi:S1C family serine protease [Bordetella genomosp. 13]|uniref:S1C family serine protease n=1 Tax=Bordetella genomosp. 13 TaxID=463040 RepID=UPI00119EEA31|nr:trypsin-like peptidase domain-containing protein [Bordetella genomosp. 13]